MKLEGKTFVALRSAGDTGQLYGSVSTRDIAEVVTAGGFTVDRRQVVMDKPIKTLGLHETRIALHPEVVVKVTLNVARSQDEAEKQARGEDVTVIKGEKLELETFNPDEVFEEGAAPKAEAEAEPRREGLDWLGVRIFPISRRRDPGVPASLFWAIEHRFRAQPAAPAILPHPARWQARDRPPYVLCGGVFNCRPATMGCRPAGAVRTCSNPCSTC